MNAFVAWADPWAQSILVGLWRASWQGGIAIAAGWAVARWCTFLSPRVICWVWRIVSLKLLVALVWASPFLIPVLPAVPRMPPAARTAMPPLASHPREFQPAADMPESVALPWASPAISAGVLAGVVWMAGVITAGVFAFRQWKAIRGTVHASLPCEHEGIKQILLAESARFGVRPLPALRLSDQLESPMLTGFFRSTILLPSGVERGFAADEVRWMVAHELAHLKRRDLGWNWLPTVVVGLLWFHPLAWLLRRQWGEAQESACDELVLQTHQGCAADYGRMLLRLATLRGGDRRVLFAAAGVLGAHRNFERRLQAISRVAAPVPRRLALAALLLALVAIPAIVPFRLIAQEPNAAQAADHEGIQGTWYLTRIDQVHHVFSDEESAAALQGKFKVEITKDRIKFWDGSSESYRLLPHQENPKRMEYVVQKTGEVVPAIYELTEHSLRICVGRKGDRSPPAGFDVQKIHRENSTAFPTCWILRREINPEGPSQATIPRKAATGAAVSGTSGGFASFGGGEAHQANQTPPSKSPQDAAAKVESLGGIITPTVSGGVAVLINRAWKGTEQDLTLVGNLQRLEIVIVDDCSRFSNQLLGPLVQAKVPSLQLMSPSDEQLTALKAYAGLVQLSLYGSQITNAGLTMLHTLPNLEQLFLGTDGRGGRSSIDDEGLSSLAKCPKLRRLVISHLPRVTGSGFAGLKKLDDISMNEVPLSDQGLKAIAQLSDLKRLQVGGSQLTSADYAPLERLTSLERLRIFQASEFDDAAAVKLSGLKSLQVLFVHGSRLGDDGLVALAGLKQLHSLELYGGSYSDRGFSQLATLAALRRLTVVGDERISDAGLNAVANMKHLKQLTLNSPLISDKGLASLAGCKQLETLNLLESAVTGSGLAQLKSLPLRTLNLNGSAVDDAGLAGIAKLQSIHNLQLNSTKITDQGLPQLAKLPRLIDLELRGGKITSAGLEALEKLKSLRSLHIDGDQVSSDAINQLRQRLPTVSVNQMGGTGIFVSDESENKALDLHP